MASVTSLGVGSGLDLEGMVTKLMAVEQQPLTVLQKKVSSYNTRISSLGTLSSVLASLQSAAAAMKPGATQTAITKFATYSASVADTTLATATSTTGAAAGKYSLSDIVLATAQQIRKSGITVPAGAGTLSIKVGAGAAIDVAIDAGSTLANVSDAINRSSAGISAAIVNDGTSDHLVLSAKDSGTANTISITGSGTGWTSSAFDYSTGTANSWTQASAAANATLNVNGIAVSSPSNTLTSAISGVSINLLKAGSTTLTVNKDTTSALTSALNSFVSAYNSANATMGGLSAYNASTKTAGALQGDSTLRTARSHVTNLLFSTAAGGTSAYQHLSDIGVSLAKDGSLSIDSAKLTKAIGTDYAGVADLVAKVGAAYDTALTGIVGSTGTLVDATKSTTAMIKAVNDRAAVISTRLTKIEANYRKQFAALDTLVASLNKTSTYLTQQLTALAALSNNTSSN